MPINYGSKDCAHGLLFWGREENSIRGSESGNSKRHTGIQCAREATLFFVFFFFVCFFFWCGLGESSSPKHMGNRGVATKAPL